MDFSLKTLSKYLCFDFAIPRKSDALPDHKGIRTAFWPAAFFLPSFFV
jgi:hypothetical protein